LPNNEKAILYLVYRMRLKYHCINEVYPMATSTSALVSLAEYLDTAYRPDCDWVEGEVKERNVGEQSHARVQAFLAYIFRLHSIEWAVRVLVEQRVQTSASRFSIPDVCVIPFATRTEEIVRTPPLLCIEILSRDDRMSDIQERVEDYLAMSVQAVWVVDPRRRRAYAALPSGALEPVPAELAVAGTAIRVPIPDIFAELDEFEPQAV
jgi:Uma2 family endonuclease